jgi:hypothetical protein
MAEQAYSANWNAEGPQFGMQALWRLAIWGGLATIALFAAAISAYSNAGSQRQAAAINGGQAALSQAAPNQATSGQASSAQGSPSQGSSGQGTAQPRTSAAEFGARPGETAEETRRLAEAVRSLAAERDQVLTRIAALERNLDGVTGSIKNDRLANPPQAVLQTPVQTPPPSPSTATSAPPPVRPETPAAPVMEAALPPTKVSAPQQSGASDAAKMAPPDAGNRAAAVSSSNSNLVRVSAPVEPLAAAGGLGVDVGGAVNYEGLRTLWRSTMNSDLALPEELYPVVTVRENGKTHGVDLRLVVGPIADAEAAERLCTTLAAARHYCQPVAFEGQRLTLIDTPKSGPAALHHPAGRASAPTVDPETPHFRAVIGK